MISTGLYTLLMLLCLLMAALMSSVSCRSRPWLVGFQLFLAAYLALILLDAQSFYLSPALYLLLLPVIFLPGPLILGYVGHISDGTQVRKQDFLWCALPVVLVVSAGPWLQLDQIWQLSDAGAYQQPVYVALFNLISLMAGLQTLGYLALSIRLVLRQRRSWREQQSRTLPQRWYQVVLALSVFVVVTVLQVASAIENPAGNSMSIGDLGFVGMVVFFFGLSLKTYREQSEVVVDELEIHIPALAQVETPISEAADQARSEPSQQPAENIETAEQVADQDEVAAEVSDPVEDALAQSLRDLSEGNDYYRQDDLSLADLASLLSEQAQQSISTHKVSQLLNQVFGCSFYEYINQLRVQYAAGRLLAQPQQSITDVFIDAGFSSKSTFYTHFKKHYHCTPSQYRKQS